MKKFFVALLFSALAVLLILPSCKQMQNTSIKALTKPYIAQYECIEASYGGNDLLEKYDYIKINIADKRELQLIYKPKDGEKTVKSCNYSFDPDTRELTADISVLGYRFTEKTTIRNGKFTINKQIGRKNLIMKFVSS